MTFTLAHNRISAEELAQRELEQTIRWMLARLPEAHYGDAKEALLEAEGNRERALIALKEKLEDPPF